MSELPGEPRLAAPPAQPGYARQGDDGAVMEQKSKIKITLNAKQDAQWEISVVEGTAPEEMERTRNLAVEQHQELLNALYGGGS